MAEILPSASYVRNPKALQDRAHQQAILSSIDELDGDETTRMWKLLETPQTVDSLCRSLGKTTEEPIRSALAALYDEDLIEVSPDS
jgi:hypothetical protein